jgi:hypothetical protein
MKWILSVLTAGAMQAFLDIALPIETPRSVVIGLGGLVALLWSRIDDALRREVPE